LGGGGRRLVQAGGLGGDDEASLAGQQALMDPAARPLPIPDFPPIFVLGDDFDRHALALEHPVDGITRARSRADIDLIRSQRGKARQRQARALALTVRGRVRGTGVAAGSHDKKAEGRQGNQGRPEGSGRSNSHWLPLYSISKQETTSS